MTAPQAEQPDPLAEFRPENLAPARPTITRVDAAIGVFAMTATLAAVFGAAITAVSGNPVAGSVAAGVLGTWGLLFTVAAARAPR